jgi:hypothetical protein
LVSSQVWLWSCLGNKEIGTIITNY